MHLILNLLILAFFGLGEFAVCHSKLTFLFLDHSQKFIITCDNLFQSCDNMFNFAQFGNPDIFFNEIATKLNVQYLQKNE